jgi:hypothetical protein
MLFIFSFLSYFFILTLVPLVCSISSGPIGFLVKSTFLSSVVPERSGGFALDIIFSFSLVCDSLLVTVLASLIAVSSLGGVTFTGIFLALSLSSAKSAAELLYP